VYFVQVAHWRRLCHEFLYALVKGAVDEEIRAVVFGATLVAERRPFAKNGWRIEIDLRLFAAHRFHLLRLKYPGAGRIGHS
jgi:hypothetical protein